MYVNGFARIISFSIQLFLFTYFPILILEALEIVFQTFEVHALMQNLTHIYWHICMYILFMHLYGFNVSVCLIELAWMHVSMYVCPSFILYMYLFFSNRRYYISIKKCPNAVLEKHIFK